ncbi:MAG: hypothetical protein NTW25_01940 [Candidatus Kapabacteria bacterium]|nr:hypothetical protein [Candidatus Kapabacteria bacterium]
MILNAKFRGSKYSINKYIVFGLKELEKTLVHINSSPDKNIEDEIWVKNIIKWVTLHYVLTCAWLLSIILHILFGK